MRTRIKKAILALRKKLALAQTPRVKRTIAIVLWLVIASGLLYTFKGIFVAAMVNGQPIARFTVVKSLEEQSGSQALSSLITKTLVFQEAKKNGVNVSQSDIDEQIKKIETSLTEQGMTLESALAYQGLTMAQLTDNIKLQKTVEQIVGKDIDISDEQIKDYYDQNKDSFEKGATLESLTDQIKDQLYQEELSSKYQTWIADLKAKANILYFVNY